MVTDQNIITIIDELTPYYKHKIETLPPQQRKVLCALARFDGAMNMTLLSKESRTEPRITSTSLTRLKRKGFVIHANRLWKLSDPWLGAWYRMRRGDFTKIPTVPHPSIPTLWDSLLLASK